MMTRKIKPSPPRFPTGIKINLRTQYGNVFYVLGTCRHIANHLGLSDEDRAAFANDTRLDGNKSYDQILDTCQQWFGVVFVGRPRVKKTGAHIAAIR